MFFSNTNRTYDKTDHTFWAIPEREKKPAQNQKEVTSYIVFSDHNRIKLEISNRKLTGKPQALEIKLYISK